MDEPQSLLDTFEHVVVRMLENRSFDNILGYLYQDAVAGLLGADEAVAENRIL